MYIQQLLSQANDLLQHGHVSAAIQVFIQQGRWDEVFRAAEQEKDGNASVARYACIYAERLVGEGNMKGALDVLVKRGGLATSETSGLYKRIIIHALSMGGVDGGDAVILSNLKSFITSLLSKTPGPGFPVPLFNTLSYAVHFYGHLTLCKQRGLAQLAATVATGMIRYIEYLPADRTYFLAGECCRNAQNSKYAYVFLNQYLDIADAIDQRLKKKDEGGVCCSYDRC
jgi:intraflagellar transport protein 172